MKLRSSKLVITLIDNQKNHNRRECHSSIRNKRNSYSNPWKGYGVMSLCLRVAGT